MERELSAFAMDEEVEVDEAAAMIPHHDQRHASVWIFI